MKTKEEIKAEIQAEIARQRQIADDQMDDEAVIAARLEVEGRKWTVEYNGGEGPYGWCLHGEKDYTWAGSVDEVVDLILEGKGA